MGNDVGMESKNTCLIAMEINIRKNGNSVINGKDPEEAFASPAKIEAH